jgi:tellurite resistance protein
VDVEDLLGSVIRSALAGRGRRKRTRGTLQFLTGGTRGSFLNASTLLAVAGVAWGLYETAMQSSTVTAATSPAAGPLPVPPASPPGPGGGAAASPAAIAGPPPLPATAGEGPAGAPVAAGPAVQARTGGTAAAGVGVPAEVLRVVRLTISAARADGQFTEAEREAILSQARAAGVDALVADDLAVPRPLAEIVAGVTDERQREELYTIAFAIVRADDRVSGSERIYLAQLASLLGLDVAAAARIEAEAAARIDRAAAG